MKRAVSKFALRNSLILSVWLISVMALMASGLKVASSSVGSKEPRVGGSADVPRPWLNIQQRRELDTRYTGDRFLVDALQSKSARGRALASADLDRDGAPDLIAGYEWDGKGIVTVQRGNPDAFAPKDDAVFELMQKGYNPDSLLPGTETYALPEPVDFLQVGDFNEDSHKDVLLAARGGGLYLLRGDGQGGLGTPEQISLPGVVTALTVGQFLAADRWSDVAVGVTGPAGSEVLVFDGAAGGFDSEALRFPLAAAVTAVEFGELDSDPFMDLAIASGSEIYAVHGWGRKTQAKPSSRVERIALSFTVQSIAVDNFIWDRQGAREIAALAADGTVHLLERAGINKQDFSAEELAARAALRGQVTRKNEDVEAAQSWAPDSASRWTETGEIALNAGVKADAPADRLLVHGKISWGETNALLLLDAANHRVNIAHQVSAKEASMGGESGARAGDISNIALDLVDQPAAVLALPRKLNGYRDLLVLGSSSAVPSVVPLAPLATITVDRTDDTAAASACTGVANDCSFRGAVIFANATPGTTINVPAGNYALTIIGNTNNMGAGEGFSGDPTIGDTDFRADTTTVTGAGAATTIIRQTTANDRTFEPNPIGDLNFDWTISGATIAGGRDTGGSFTGGGGAMLSGSKDNTTTITNCVIANNRATGAGTTGGGGISNQGGSVTITNSTIGGSTTVGACPSQADVTCGNSTSASGGGLGYSPGDPFNRQPSAGTLTIQTTTAVTNNTAASLGAGGAGADLYTHNLGTGSVGISSATFTSNLATGTASGGGIIVESIGTTVAMTSFTNNSAANRGGGIYVGGGSLLLDGTSPSVTFTGNTATVAGSSISAASAVSVSGANTTIGGDLEVTTNGVWTNNSGSTISPTNLIITGTGSFTANNSTTNVGGNFQFASGTFNAGTGLFNFNGTGTQSITNSSSITFNNLTDSNTTQPLTANNSFAVGGNLNVNGVNAIFAPVATAIISGAGTLTGTGTARVTRTAATPDFLSQYTITNKTLTNLTVEYIGAAQTVSATTYGGLKINNASGPTLGGAVTVNGTLTLMTGALGVGTNTLNINNGTSVGTGTLTSSATGTVNYGQGSGGQSVLAANYGNLTFSNFSKVLPSSGVIGVAGTFTPGSGVGHTITGSTFDFNSTGAQTIPAFNYNNLTISGARTTNSVTLVNGGAIGIAGTFNPSATFTSGAFVIANNTIDFNGVGAQTVPSFNYNNLTISGARTTNSVTLVNGATVRIAGAFNPSATFTSGAFVVTGNTVEYNGGSAQSLPSGFTTYNNLTLNNAAGTTGFAGLIVQGLLRVQSGVFTSSSTYKDVQIDSGATLAASSGSTINVSGNWTNNGTFTANNGAVNFNGSLAETISGSSTTTFNNLTINNAAGVTLSADIAINGTLTLQAGALAIGSRTLTLNNAISITSGSFTSNANGTVNYNQSSNGQSIAPGNYGNLTFSNFQKTLPSSGTVKIAGTFTTGAGGGHTLTGNTVEFNGASAQTLPSNFTTYNNLTLNNPAGVIGFAGLTVQGLLRVQAGTFTTSSSFKDVQIDNGATLAATAASTINVSGNWSNSGTFTGVTGTVIFNANAVGQALSGNTTFNNLTINHTGAGNVDATGSTLTVSGLLRIQAGTFISSSTFKDVQIDSGQTLQGANATTMSVSGNWTNNGGTFTPSGNTVNFNGSGAQSINGTAASQTFNNFTVNKSGGTLSAGGSTTSISTNDLTMTAGSFTAPATLDINGNTLLTAGTLTAGTSITAAGNWTNNGGTFTAGAGTVTFDGAGQTIGGTAATTFNNLTNGNNSVGGIAMNNDNTVTGILALSSSDITVANTKTLTQPGTIASTGAFDVVGSVKRTGSPNLATGTALTFGNPFNSVSFLAQGTTPTDITVNLDKAVPTTPAPFAGAIARKYTITPNGGSGISATLRLHYLDPELNGNTEGMGLNLFRYDGANWHKEGQTGFNTTDNWVEKSGVTQFSPWTMNSSVPTEARLESFRATGYEGGTFIEWGTGFEVDNLGFNVYREEGGKRLPVNSQLVAGSALMAGSGVVMRAGQSYALWDNGASGAQYWLESVDINGQSSWLGPFFSKFVGGDRPARGDSSLLGGIGNARERLTLPVERAALPQSMKPEQIKLQSGLAGQAAVKMWVKREGFYRVTASELVQAGFDPKADTRLLQLYAEGQQIPINVITHKEGLLSAIEFYGRGLDAAYTDARVYWFVSGSRPGLRIDHVKGASQPTVAQSFLYTVERKDRTIYFSGLRNGERENFFGAVIGVLPVDQSLTIQHVDQSAAGAATIQVALQGVTTLPHRVWVYINGVFAGDLAFDGQTEGISSFTVAQSLLRSGENQVRLVAQGGPGDISLVDYIRLSYWHSFTADDNSLRLTATGNQKVTINGFTSGAIRVLDVTDPDAPQELVGKIDQQKTGYSVTVASPGAGEKTLLAAADDLSSKPSKIDANQPSNWRTTSHAADLVVISRRDFFSAIEPLEALRSKQGLKVELADIEDVFDEFSFGDKSPQAVKDFLSYAKANWTINPRYLLLVGDASHDPKDYLGFGDWDIVPTKLIDTQLMETASDDWLADFNGNGIADLAIGRLPVRTAEEAVAMVRKIVGYDRSQPLQSMLLVADINNGFDFESSSTELRALIPANLKVEQINRGQVDPATAKSRLMDAITRGQKVVNYIGHGSLNLWAGSLLTNEDARSLRNEERLPVFVMMTCLNGYFHDPALDSLAEALLKAEQGGAVAVWASTGMTTPAEQSVLNKQLYRLLFTPGSANEQALTLGDATARAKASVTDGDIRRTWVLLGDPTMRMR